MSSAHASAAGGAHAQCFVHLPIADAYSLSADEVRRRGVLKRTDEVDLTYGDVPFHAIERMLTAVSPPPGSLFYDLGSGVGRGVIAAALLHDFSHCVGIELLADLHAATAEPARQFFELRMAANTTGLDSKRMAANVSFVNADIFDCNLAEDIKLRSQQQLCCHQQEQEEANEEVRPERSHPRESVLVDRKSVV